MSRRGEAVFPENVPLGTLLLLFYPQGGWYTPADLGLFLASPEMSLHLPGYEVILLLGTMSGIICDLVLRCVRANL